MNKDNSIEVHESFLEDLGKMKRGSRQVMLYILINFNINEGPIFLGQEVLSLISNSSKLTIDSIRNCLTNLVKIGRLIKSDKPSYYEVNILKIKK